jgi:hypothetical protein
MKTFTLQDSVADPGCLSWMPDPNFFHPGPRIQGQKDFWIQYPDSHQNI